MIRQLVHIYKHDRVVCITGGDNETNVATFSTKQIIDTSVSYEATECVGSKRFLRIIIHNKTDSF